MPLRAPVSILNPDKNEGQQDTAEIPSIAEEVSADACALGPVPESREASDSYLRQYTPLKKESTTSDPGNRKPGESSTSKRGLQFDSSSQTSKNSMPGSKRGSHFSSQSAGQHLSLSVLESEFDQLDKDEDGFVSSFELLAQLEENGILANDPRLVPLTQALKARSYHLGDVMLTFPMFVEAVTDTATLIVRGLHGDLVVPHFKDFTDTLAEIFQETSCMRDGTTADHIPELAQVDPDLFGVSICTVDGQRWSIGQSTEPFCLQSLSQPLQYLLAVEELGSKYVHSHVGCEASGRGCNEMVLQSIDPDHHPYGARAIPHNPLVNSGGIMVSSLLLNHERSMANRFKALSKFVSRICGGAKIDFRNSTYLSEKEVAHRNWALAYMMLENGAFPENTELRECLDLFFQGQALESNCQTMAVAAATLASGGLCPLTDDRVCSPTNVRSCLSIMSSCGVYDFSGQWAFRIGLPAKSCVAGVTMVVIPNLMGMCIYSPRIDSGGNSPKAVRFCEILCEKFSMHVYETVKTADTSGGPGGSKNDIKVDRQRQKEMQITELLFAAAAGDVYGIRRMIGAGFDITDSDYDDRTALHVASSNGNYRACKLLCSNLKKICNGNKDKLKMVLSPLDRWNRTPLEDAISSDNENVVDLLKQYGAVSSSDLELYDDDDDFDNQENDYESNKGTCSNEDLETEEIKDAETESGIRFAE